MTMHRVLCCGGRNFNDATFVTARLDELRQVLGDFAVIHGDARGADKISGEWGRRSGLPVIAVAANWGSYSYAAGSIRNGWMLDLCFPTYAVAFPGGTGTADMVRRCNARNIPVWEF